MLSLHDILADTVDIVVAPPPLTAEIWATLDYGSIEQRKLLISWFNNLQILLSGHIPPPAPAHDRHQRNSRGLLTWQILANVLVGGTELWRSKLYWSPSQTSRTQIRLHNSDFSPVDGYQAFFAVLSRLCINPGLLNP
jgi:hypothetical protein